MAKAKPITFPSFSRLQTEKEILKKAIEKSIFAASFFIFPSLVGLVVLAPYFIHIIPKYTKWEPAVFSISFFALNALFSSISTPLTNALNAIGKIKTTLYLMIFWTVATWILTPIFIFIFGFNGVSMASALIAVSVILVVYIVRRHVDFDVVQSVKQPVVSSLIMGLIIYFLSKNVIFNIFSLIAVIIFGAILYFGIAFLIGKRQILSDIALIKKNIAK